MRSHLCLIACSCVVSAGCLAHGDDSNSAAALFANPPRAYSSAPLWVWNDLLTEEQIAGTLRDLAGQQVKQVFVHPRPGLMTPYLSEDWFRLWKAALKEAESLDMNVWIYDENSYPSGFAGGFVPEAMPESRGLGLNLRQTKKPAPLGDNVVAVFRQVEGKYVNVTEQARAGKEPPDGDYVIATIQESGKSPWFGGQFYVDLLRSGVTQKFLEITMDAYRREIGDQFGKRMPGVFTDEPHLAPAGGLHWTPDLPLVFEKRWGYSLMDNLPSLTLETGDWKRVRHDYFQVLLDLFIDRRAKPYHDYCEREGIEFTGHYWEHGWPGAVSAPDNMAMYAWHQRPSIDTLFNQYSEDVHAQFGNVRSVLELASAANQTGRRRTLCETYGGSGWDARFEDLKRIGDWVYVLGVNTLNEHLSHITIRGARKRDYPPTFSYHEPWWDAYHVLAGYFTRLSVALSQGEQINTILVLEPTTTAWMYQTTGGDRLEALGNAFQRLVVDLAKAQVEFDLGSEDILTRQGAVDGTSFVVGKRRYDTVVLPPLTENLNAKTMDLLETYAKAGGVILSCSDAAPALVDAQASDRGAALAQSPGWTRAEPGALPVLLLERCTKSGLAVRQAEGSQALLFHHRRQLDDGDLLFLVNTSADAAASGVVESAARGVQQWNPETGAVSAYPFKKAANGVQLDFALPPSGSLLLFFSKEAGKPAPPQVLPTERIELAGPMTIRRIDPNVLTLDYMDVTAGGETKVNVPSHEAAQFAFRQSGLGRNPWNHAVQFRDEFIAKTFPADSGVKATYRFTIQGAPPKPLWAVIERPDLYTVECNGARIAAEPGAWWLDRSFGKLDISGVAKEGENTIAISASPFSVFLEIEAAYILGDFSLQPADNGFVIAAPKDLSLGPWNEQGYPLYGHAVSYTQEYNIPAPKGRYAVSLRAWYGSVAKVQVNGQLAGYVYHQPWDCDVTKYLTAGKNAIDVTVIGTLKNTLGPHHGNPPLGLAGPDSFNKGPNPGPPPGSQYATIGYGLFEPFDLSGSKGR